MHSNIVSHNNINYSLFQTLFSHWNLSWQTYSNMTWAMKLWKQYLQAGRLTTTKSSC